MTGKFSHIDHARCAHYARFLQYITIAEANVIFWCLFVFVLILMCTASIQHHKHVTLTESLKAKPKPSPGDDRRIHRHRIHYLSIASLCFLLALISIVFEVFALLNIQFCAGEDLMQLYWGFWSVLQVGSIVAIFGVMLQFWLLLGNVQTPSWAVALGTPVLVVAALGYVIRHIGKSLRGKVKKEKGNGTDIEAGKGGSGDEKNYDDDDDIMEKGDWAERWISWTPDQNQAKGEWREDTLEKIRTVSSANCSDMEFASRATTMVSPVEPGNVKRSLTS